MKRLGLFLAGAALALGPVLVLAQDAPESLLPPGFDKPKPKAAPKPAASATPKAAEASGPTSVSSPVVQALPSGAAQAAAPVKLPANLPSLAALEAMTPEQLDDLFGLHSRSDIPAGARRAVTRVGVLAEWEGGLPSGSLAGQNASLVGAMLAGNDGRLVSRWGHILLRRVLASRLDAPAGMNPADFAGLRAALLVRMGEGDAARALVQDVDAANYTPVLTQAALDAYAQTADVTGACPMVNLQGGVRKDPDWRVLQAICRAFSGDATNALIQLDRLQGAGVWPKIDMLLAQKYAGSAGKAARAVTIEWDGVNTLTPWRYALTVATGIEPPARLIQDPPLRYSLAAAIAPMVSLQDRAAGADRAGAAGVLSSAAMVDLYGEIYALDDISGEWSQRAEALRNAYVAAAPSDRLAAMKQLWDGAADPAARYSRLLLTAYAAARLPVEGKFAGDSGDLVAAMLAAGLDRNALRWAPQAEVGGLAWAQLALAAPQRSGAVTSGQLDDFYGNDGSAGKLRTRLLLAGLAGLGRVDSGAAAGMAGKLEVDLARQTRWTRAIDAAAAVNNQALVALLAGAGMQGDAWDKMTTVHLYHIVSALDRVGLSAEARMIAAEAVARG